MNSASGGIGALSTAVLVSLLLFACSSRTALAQTDSLGRATDPNAFRLFLAPTSVTLPENHGTIQLADVVVPTVNYGIIDELIVRGGFTPFTVASHILYYGLAGLQVFDYGGFSGVGGVAITNATGGPRGWESTLYGFGVVGYTAKEFGIYGALGGGYSGKSETSTAIFMLGGEYTVNAHNKVISENWFLGDSGTNAFSFGLRSYGSLFAIDFGIMGITEAHTMKISTVVPWIALSYHFDVSD